MRRTKSMEIKDREKDIKFLTAKLDTVQTEKDKMERAIEELYTLLAKNNKDYEFEKTRLGVKVASLEYAITLAHQAHASLVAILRKAEEMTPGQDKAMSIVGNRTLNLQASYDKNGERWDIRTVAE